MRTPPQSTHTFGDLSPDRSQRKELLLEVFGEHLFWMRNERLSTLEELLNSSDARNKLGTIQRKPFEAMAAHSSEANNAALQVAKATVDLYIQDLLSLFTDIGKDMRFGSAHSLQYRLILEIRDSRSGSPMIEETINRDGPTWLPGYFGKWLNKYRKWGTMAGDARGTPNSIDDQI